MMQLRAEADAAIERAEQAEAKNRAYEQQILQLGPVACVEENELEVETCDCR